jgi:putative SOS response-associated peptidase YedK
MRLLPRRRLTHHPSNIRHLQQSNNIFPDTVGDIITQTQNVKQDTQTKNLTYPPDPEQQVSLDAMDIEKGDYQTGSARTNTEEEHTDCFHPIDRKTRQSSIPLEDKKKRDHR